MPRAAQTLRTAAAFAALAVVAAADEPLRVELEPGEVYLLCKSGTIVCPAKDPVCDDLAIATAVGTVDGLAFKGVAPGTTTCSAASASGSGLRRVYRVVVRAKR